MPRLNAIDKFISYFNPSAGLRRAVVRDNVRAYEAAGFGRRTKMFDNSNSSGPNLEISGALSTLRNRSRGMVRNNGWAKRAIVAITRNVVGEGIRPAPVGTRNQIKKAKQLWKNWAESTDCDWYGKSTFYGLQSLAMNGIAEGGDILILRRRVKSTKDNPIPIKIQLLESDMLDHYKDFDSYNGKSYCRLGVQFSKDGILEGYWVYDTHPTDGTSFTTSTSSSFVSKEDCIHVYELLRIGQIRGIPMGVAAFIKLGDFSDYEDAQLLRQKIAACFVAFVSGDETTPLDDDPLQRLEPGIIEYLKAGETVTFGNPPPAEGYSEYSKKILQGIAAAYGITYEMLTMDYSNVNFSSGRMAKIDISGVFRNLQYNMLVPQMCVPVWDWFMQAAIMAGLTTTKIVCSCTDWTAPRVQQLDPTKETSARVLQIQAGLTTISECLREDGRDPEEFFEEYKQDMQRLKDLGITVSSIVLPQIIEDSQNNNSNGNNGNKD